MMFRLKKGFDPNTFLEEDFHSDHAELNRLAKKHKLPWRWD